MIVNVGTEEIDIIKAGDADFILKITKPVFHEPLESHRSICETKRDAVPLVKSPGSYEYC